MCYFLWVLGEAEEDGSFVWNVNYFIWCINELSRTQSILRQMHFAIACQSQASQGRAIPGQRKDPFVGNCNWSIVRDKGSSFNENLNSDQQPFHSAAWRTISKAGFAVQALYPASESAQGCRARRGPAFRGWRGGHRILAWGHWAAQFWSPVPHSLGWRVSQG